MLVRNELSKAQETLRYNKINPSQNEHAQTYK